MSHVKKAQAYTYWQVPGWGPNERPKPPIMHYKNKDTGLKYYLLKCLRKRLDTRAIPEQLGLLRRACFKNNTLYDHRIYCRIHL